MNTTIAEEALVKEHILEMIAAFEEVEVFAATIVPESLVDLVLETLSNSFSHFKLNYNMNKLEMTLTELIKDLQIIEKVIRPQSKALVIKLSSSRTGSKPKNFKKMKKGNVVA
jgi:hypothetical protein